MVLSNKMAERHKKYKSLSDKYWQQRLGVNSPNLDALSKAFERIEREKNQADDPLAEFGIGQDLGTTKPKPKQDDGGFFDFLENLNPFRDRNYEEEVKNIKARLNSREEATGLDRVIGRAADSVTLGGLEFLDERFGSGKFNDQYLNKREFGEGGGMDFLSSTLGYLAPGGLAAGAVRGTKLGANITANMGRGAKFGQRAKEGAILGAGLGTIEEGFSAGSGNGFDPKNIALDTLFGAALDPSIGALGDGLGKLGNEIIPSFRARNSLRNGQGVNQFVPKNVTYQGQPMDNSFSFLDNMSPGTTSNPDGSFNVDDISSIARSLNPSERVLSPEDLLRARDPRNPLLTGSTNPIDEVLGLNAPLKNRRPEPELNKILGLPPGQTKLDQIRDPFGLRYANEGEPLQFKKEIGVQSKKIDDFLGLDNLSYTGRSERPFSSTRVDGGFRTEPTNDGVRVSSEPQRPFKRTIEQERQPKFTSSENINLDDFFSNSTNRSEPEVSNPKGEGRPLGQQSGDGISGVPMSKGVAKIREKFDKIYSNWVNKQNEAVKYSRKVTGQRNSKFEQSLAVERGAKGAAYQRVEEELVPVFERARKQGIDSDSLLEFATRLRAEELYNKKGWDEKTSLPPKFSKKNNAEFMKNHDSPAMRQAIKELQQFQERSLDLLVESGYLSKANRDKMRTEQPFYFPMFRDLPDDPSDFTRAFADMFGTGENRAAVKSLSDEGADYDIKDPMENLLANTFNIQRAAFRNRTMQELSKLAQMDPDGNMARVLKPNENAKGTVFKARFDGVEQRIEVNKELGEALMEEPNPEAMLKFVEGLANIQRTSATIVPDFQLRSLVRDIPQAYITSRGGFSLWRDVPASVLEIIKDNIGFTSKEVQDFVRNGGSMNSVYTQDRNLFYELQRKAQKEGNALKVLAKDVTTPNGWINMIKDTWNVLRSVGENVENIPKLAEYRATVRNETKKVKKGKSNKSKEDIELEAAYNSRDIMDFARAGRKGQKLNRTVAFINANIQSKDKLARAIKENKYRVAWRTAQVVAAPTLAFQALYSHATDKQKQSIDESPTWLKETYWLVPSLNDGESVYRIPKPFEVALVANMIEKAFEQKRGVEDPRTVRDQALAAIKSNFFIDPSLNPFTVPYEIATNTDTFTGQPIIPTSKQPIPKGMQGDVYTSEMGKVLANMVNSVPYMDNILSPYQADHILEGYTTSAFGWADDLTSSTKENPKPEGTGKSLNPWDRAFKTKTEGQSSAYVGELYKARENLRGIKKVYVENGGDADKFPYARTYTALNKAIDGDLRKLSTAINKIDNDPDMTAAEKKEKRLPLIEKRNEIARKLKDTGIFEKINDIYGTLN